MCEFDTHTYTYGNSRWRDLLTAYDGQSITYDQIGNPLTYRNGMYFSWQNGRQLSAVLNNSTVTNYTYNADGTRHSKTTRTNVEKTTTYYYVEGTLYAVDNGDYTVVFQFDETGTPYGFRLLFHDGSGRGETCQYYKYNLQGDVVGIYDTSGNEVVTYTYDPWGKLLSATGVDVLIDANPLLYRGYVYDKETGFYYCNSRYYDPEIGRWINADGMLQTPIGSVLSTNMFAYCENNPVNFSDPTGEFALGTILGKAVLGAVVNVVTTYIGAKVTGQSYSWKDAGIAALTGALGTGKTPWKVVAGVVSGGYTGATAYRNGADPGKALFAGVFSAWSTTASVANIAGWIGPTPSLGASALSDLVFGMGANILSAAISRASVDTSILNNIKESSGTQITDNSNRTKRYCDRRLR